MVTLVALSQPTLNKGIAITIVVAINIINTVVTAIVNFVIASTAPALPPRWGNLLGK